jgi:hypothetical protein
MAEWLEYHVAAIGFLNFDLVDCLWINWRPGRAHRWIAETISWEGRGNMDSGGLIFR